MTNIVDLEVLALVIVASAVIAKFVEGVKARFALRWEALDALQKENAGVLIALATAGLMWLTGLNMLPGFSAVYPLAGRILTCVIAGLGPGILYDVALDKPTLTPKAPER